MLRRWQCHKIVEAEPITGWADTLTSKTVATGEGINAYRHEVPENFFKRGFPEVGDYFVRYQDGHLSWSPRQAFEEGYTLLAELSGGRDEPIAQGVTFGGGQMPLLVDHNGRAIAVVPEAMEKLEEIRAIILRDRHEPRSTPPAETNWKANRPWLEGSDISDDAIETVEIELPDGVALRSASHPTESDPRDKLVRFLVARIAKFEEGYETVADRSRMEELSWLLLQAVGGNIV